MIRPQVQLQDVLRKRFEANQTGLSETEQLQQANALYSLLDNRYKKKVRGSIPGGTKEREIRTIAGSPPEPPRAQMLMCLVPQYPITGTLMQPKSNPTYFNDLVKELDEAPNRSWTDRMMLRLKGVVRLQ